MMVLPSGDAIEQRHEELEVLLVAVVQCRGRQQEVARQRGEQLPGQTTRQRWRSPRAMSSFISSPP